MLQTYTLETCKSDIEKIIRNQIKEPLIIENQDGTNYLLLPFSPERMEEVFLMMYQTLNELNREKEKKQSQKKSLNINSFSFMQSIEATKNFDCSFSDTLIEERRAEL